MVFPEGGNNAPDSTPPNTSLKLIDRKVCIQIAKSTLQHIEAGRYELDGIIYKIEPAVTTTNAATQYYPPDSELSQWAVGNSERVRPEQCSRLRVMECSTLEGARRLKSQLGPPWMEPIGVLNFASAKSPGGGFLGGARAQEESIARSSTLYPSLKSSSAQPFYALHNANSRHGLYSHAMIYSPGVLFMRADSGDWLHPLTVDVLTTPAVNAGSYRNYLRKQGRLDETQIDDTMRERMARILYLFELRGVRNLVLGSFGTGAFKNSVDLVTGVWKELLVGKGSRFSWSFDNVIFAVVDSPTYQKFESVLGSHPPNLSQRDDTHSLVAVPDGVNEEVASLPQTTTMTRQSPS